jgi:hypothetical protein
MRICWTDMVDLLCFLHTPHERDGGGEHTPYRNADQPPSCFRRTDRLAGAVRTPSLGPARCTQLVAVAGLREA